MKTSTFIIVSILLITTLSCRFLPLSDQTPEKSIATTEASSYENNYFAFTIPEGWGMMLFGGEYYDLDLEKQVTIHNNSIAIRSDAFFTVATSPLAVGEDLDSRFNQAYDEPKNVMRNVSIQPFEKEGLTGYEISYQRPWGEPTWQFNDFWLEKNSIIYVISFRTDPNAYSTYIDTLTQILGSFNFEN